ncbi:MAG: hypothetical protein KDD64_14060 [Bdellovibrionales bacterium]|nr:hypothetical protein [Bdellovibrionales bacterium]
MWPKDCTGLPRVAGSTSVAECGRLAWWLGADNEVRCEVAMSYSKFFKSPGSTVLLLAFSVPADRASFFKKRNIPGKPIRLRLIEVFLFLLSILGATDAIAKPTEQVASLQSARTACPGPSDYAEIWTAEDLLQITEDMLANNSPALKYRQCADITLPADGIFPLGRTSDGRYATGGFQGEYLGQGHRISGIRPDSDYTGVFGLFVELRGATISQLELNDAHFVGNNRAGILASAIQNSHIQDLSIAESSLRTTNTEGGAIAGTIIGSSLQNVSVSATIGASGGLAGTITSSSIEDIRVQVTRDSNSALFRFGGISDSFAGSFAERVAIQLNAQDAVGLQLLSGFANEVRQSQLQDIIVSDSYFPYASSKAAGIATNATFGTLIERARVNASLSADWQVGGIVARSEGSTVRDSLFTGTLQSHWSSGGIVGSGSAGGAGGLIPTVIERCAIRNANLIGRGPVGGIAGELYSYAPAQSSVVDSYALASIYNDGVSNEYTNLGGISGLPLGSRLSRVLFSGPVDGGEYVGGITGATYTEADIQSAFFNSDFLSLDNGAGTPASQTNMTQDASLYADFDLLQVWRFTPGSFPDLRSIQLLRIDINQDFAISVEDIFAFLGLYFSASLEADFSGDGDINAADIFAYLSVWFGA